MPIKRISCTLFFAVLISFSFFFLLQPEASSADELEDINKELAKLSDELSKSVAATKPLESELVSIQGRITNIKGRVVNIEKDMVVKRKEIDNGYQNLTEKEKIINQAIREYYVQSYYDSPLLVFLSIDNASKVTQTLAYQKAKTDRDKATITNIALSIVDLERKKNQLEVEQKQLISLKSNLDTQSAKLDEAVKGAKSFQADLNGKIAALSAKQQEIVAAKSGGFTFSLSDGEMADEYLSSAKGFHESAPSGYFAIFSIGAYSHRNGMSQYGAKARADAGQSVEDILKAYYPNATLKKDFSVMGSISVDGFGSMPFEDQYLQGIYEMPGGWNISALKAQAIAARTYAVRRTSNGQSSICTTQSCQVFKNEKKGGNWEVAVNETKGWVLVDGSGNPVSTEYASTHGAFSKTAGWDTTDGSGGTNFIDKAYEKLGGSPWLYKAWWRQGTSNSGNTCGRSNPWLSPQEMADLVNAAVALKTGGIDTGRITPVTTACWGGNPYSMDELRKLVEGKGGISSATSVSVSQGNGTTNSVTINGVTLSASEFRQIMNLRAPGYISIPQSDNVYGAPFFNIEKK